MTDNVLRMQIKLNATPERVYQAITDDAALTTWFTEKAAVSIGEGAYDFWGRFTPGAPTREQGKHPISESEVGRVLAYDWHIEDKGTHATLQLHPQSEDKTYLTLQHANADDGVHHYGAIGLEDFWFLSLENLRRYLDGKPSDARVDYSQSMKGDVTHTLEVDADAATVFNVLTSPEQLNRWIASNATVELKVDGTYDLGWGDGLGAIKILDLKPNEKLAYEWEGEGLVGRPTVVTWTLEEGSGKTRLTLTHSGFDDDTDVSGIYGGWRNFQNWVRSIAEYGDNWQPPIVRLRDKSFEAWYPKSISQAQDELLFKDEA